MTTNIRITALTDIGNNILYSSLVPVVDMAGTPTTKKANLQIVGNLLLSGAGGTYFAPAARAILSQSVTNAAQPNITSVGTLTTLTVSGNISASNITGGNLIVANFFSGNGSSLSAIAGANVSGFVPNANVANTALAVAAANVSGLGNIATVNLTGSNSDVLYGNGVFAAVAGGSANTGNVTFDDVTIQGVNQLNLSAGPDFTANLAYLQVRAGDVASHIHFDTGDSSAYDLIIGNDQKFVQVSSTGNILMSSYDGATAYEWNMDNTGNLAVPGNINFSGDSSAAPSLNDFFSLTSAADFSIIADSGNTSATWEFAADGTTYLAKNQGSPVSYLATPINDANTSLNLQGGNGVTITSNPWNGSTIYWTFGNAGTVQSPVVAFSALPAATTPGLRAFISDANLVPAGNFGVEVSGGGGNYVPVFSDGANWCIG